MITINWGCVHQLREMHSTSGLSYKCYQVTWLYTGRQIYRDYSVFNVRAHKSSLKSEKGLLK